MGEASGGAKGPAKGHDAESAVGVEMEYKPKLGETWRYPQPRWWSRCAGRFMTMTPDGRTVDATSRCTLVGVGKYQARVSLIAVVVQCFFLFGLYGAGLASRAIVTSCLHTATHPHPTPRPASPSLDSLFPLSAVEHTISVMGCLAARLPEPWDSETGRWR